ncbi:CHASE domain-containing protein [Candidatus Saccharibacteria bacterium]|nr:MAG: CHASE domain-containing protein [Candidatus Saccharibacteria bacterium]
MRKTIQTSIKKISPTSNHEISQLVFALLVVLVGVVVSYVMSMAVAQQSVRDQQAATTAQTTAVRTYLTTQLHSYEQLLHSASAVFAVRPDLSRNEWREYLQKSRTFQDYPAILGIGYAQVVAGTDIARHEQTIRQDPGLADYTVHPVDQRDMYTAIVYLEPANDSNRRAMGYDMFSEPVRRMAMEHARDSANAAMTAPVRLVQDQDDPSKTGVLLYYPMYRTVTVPTTIEERRAALTGYVYIAVRPSDIIANTFASEDNLRNMSFTLSDVDTQQVTYLQTQPSNGLRVKYEDDAQMAILDRNWQVKLVSYQSVLQRYTGPATIFLLGVIVSTIAGGIMYILLIARLRRISSDMDQEVKRAKDDILALTSHQLRTPASGVKQYLGMLKQGFMGPLTTDQQQIAEKAYHANERQLEIIDQMLHVAKADAGKLKMVMTAVTVAPLVHEVLEALASDIRRKKITPVLRLAPSATVHGDARYVRMILENLISNAIKYSYDDSSITITVKKHQRSVVIIVADKGVGIAEPDIAKLFTKFGRLSNELSVKEGGSGLGLFLAKLLVERHHGKLLVASKLGRGTTFTCSLPSVAADYRGV